MRILSFTLIFLFLIGLTPAQAGVTQNKLELEKQIQERVSTVVRSFDESAIVTVKIKLRKIKAQNLGFSANTEVVPLEDGNGLGAESIEEISVRVISAKTEVPEWTKNEINLVAQIDKVPVKLDFVSRTADQNIESPNQMVAKFDEMMKSISMMTQSVKLGFLGFLGLIFVSAVLIVWSVRSLSARFETSFGKLIDEKVVPNMNQRSAQRPIEKDEKRSAQATPMASAPSSQETSLEGLSTDSLQKLFSDCYWTHSDGYAHFLWAKLSISQRESLLKIWTLDSNYFNFIVDVEQTPGAYHLNPHYLNAPASFDTINQEDLSALLLEKPALVSQVSPMRWDLLTLPLVKRVEFTSLRSQEQSAQVVPTINKKSSRRALQAKLRISSVTVEDERLIWSNPSLVPHELRQDIPTLIWLALAESSARKSVLNDLDARQIADAWVGPEEVLKALENELAPKKLEMVHHFAKNGEASRDSDTFKYLHQISITLPLADVGENKVNTGERAAS